MSAIAEALRRLRWRFRWRWRHRHRRRRRRRLLSASLESTKRVEERTEASD